MEVKKEVLLPRDKLNNHNNKAKLSSSSSSSSSSTLQEIDILFTPVLSNNATIDYLNDLKVNYFEFDEKREAIDNHFFYDTNNDNDNDNENERNGNRAIADHLNYDRLLEYYDSLDNDYIPLEIALEDVTKVVMITPLHNSLNQLHILLSKLKQLPVSQITQFIKLSSIISCFPRRYNDNRNNNDNDNNDDDGNSKDLHNSNLQSIISESDRMMVDSNFPFTIIQTTLSMQFLTLFYYKQFSVLYNPSLLPISVYWVDFKFIIQIIVNCLFTNHSIQSCAGVVVVNYDDDDDDNEKRKIIQIIGNEKYSFYDIKELLTTSKISKHFLYFIYQSIFELKEYFSLSFDSFSVNAILEIIHHIIITNVHIHRLT